MIAFLTDIHFGVKSFNKSVFRLQMEYFEREFFPFLLKYNIKHVFHLGDFVHNRTSIDLFILTAIKKRFFQWFEDNDVKFHTLIGNHDTYYKSTLFPNFYSENVKEFKNVVVYTEPKTVEVEGHSIGMMPWILDTDAAVFPEDVDVLCGHLDIKDFPMHARGINSMDGYDKSFFAEYNQVLTGHYHVKSLKKNIRYIGTPYQLSWNDFDVDKGFWILNDDAKLLFVPNTDSPKFVKIYYRELDGNQVLQVVGLSTKEPKKIDMAEAVQLAKKNYVKLIVERLTNHQLFDDMYTLLSDASIGDYKIEVIDVDEIIESIDYELTGDAFAEGNTLQSITQYIMAMTFDEGIDKRMLLDICNKLHLKAEDQKIDIHTSA